jgi:beta-glucosidase
MSSGLPLRFPPGFVWGTATSAFQIEGSPRADGKGESNWDRFCSQPNRIERGENAEEACDSYRRYPQDLDLMAELGLGAYRFSISWPRIIPDGVGAVSSRGLDHYSRLVDALLERGIEPWVTLYHWDLPQSLEDAGGWPQRATVDAFRRYAEVVAGRLGDRVSRWITVNEPWVVANCGYRWGTHAPGLRDDALAFRAAFHLLVAHGAAYRVIKTVRPDARVGWGHFGYRPRVLGEIDRQRVADAITLNASIYLDPILRGEYPERARALLGKNAPVISVEDLRIAHGTDFIGVQYYKDELLHPVHTFPMPTYDFFSYTETGWPITPSGLHDHLMELNASYSPAEIVVTENGAAFRDVLESDGQVHDGARIAYLRSYLEQVHRAIAAGAPVRGYFCWSLLDNFEWTFGYRTRFGLIYTDFATQKRYIKDSGRYFAAIVRDNGLQ